MKTYERQFETHIDLDSYTRAAEEVIAGIENDTINVFRPDDNGVLHSIDENGCIVIGEGTLPVSIREWLPVVCQFIRWEHSLSSEDSEKVVNGCYHSNTGEVLWPADSFCSLGPGALLAGIGVRQKYVFDTAKDNVTIWNGLKFILAHELVHAFNEMRFAVPAFMDWPTFSRVVLDEGLRTDLVGANIHERGLFMDLHYGEELELTMVEEFWPSQAATWFAACRS